MPQGLILLGEDNDDDCFLFERVIRKAGWSHQIIVLQAAQEIQSYLSARNQAGQRLPLPSIVFLDGQLRHEPSFEILRWMKRQSHLTDLPVFVLSGSIDPKVCEEAKRMGARDCFEKPLTLAHLSQIESLIVA